MVLYYVHVTVWLYAGILMICGWVQITKIFMYLPKMVFKRLSYFMVIILKFSTTWSNVRKPYEKVTQEEIDNLNRPIYKEEIKLVVKNLLKIGPDDICILCIIQWTIIEVQNQKIQVIIVILRYLSWC